jgi:hypothetical protein
MKIDFKIENLPQLIQLSEVVGAIVASVLAAFRRDNPDLTNITDAQIIARVTAKASTGEANADALIDRLIARG